MFCCSLLHWTQLGPSTMKVGLISPLVALDLADLGTTIVVVQALCLTILNLFPMQNTSHYLPFNQW